MKSYSSQFMVVAGATAVALSSLVLPAVAAPFSCVEAKVESLVPVKKIEEEFEPENLCPKKPDIDVVNCTVLANDGFPADIQIQQLELNELAISALFNGWVSEDLIEVLGRTEDVVETPATEEIRHILRKFSEFRGPLGSKSFTFAFHDDYFRGGVEDVDPDEAESGETSGNQARAPRSTLYNIARFGAPNSGIENLRYEVAPSKEDVDSISASQWRRDHKLWYGLQSAMRFTFTELPSLRSKYRHDDDGCWGPPKSEMKEEVETATQRVFGRKRDLIQDVMAWDYMRRDELFGFHEQQERFLSIMSASGLLSEKRRVSLPAFRSDQKDLTGEPTVPKFIDAMQYFAKGHFPQDFVPVFHGLYEESWEKFFFPRRVHLKVAVVVNQSDREVSLRQFGLNLSRDVNLRKVQHDKFSVAKALAQPDDKEWTLAPGGRIAVPLRISLAYEPSVLEYFKDQKAAKDIHSQIREFPDEAELEYNKAKHWAQLMWTKPLLRRDVSSFSPPSKPQMDAYVHDVSAKLEYIETRLGRVRMPGAELPSISLSFTAHSAGAQCPYLYAWSDDEQSFKPLGKILVSSNFDYRARQQTVRLRETALRFQIKEEEHEVSFINQVALLAQLNDGRELRIEPDVEALRKEDEAEVMLRSGEMIDFSFALPEGVNETDLAATSLDIKGHYIRYGQLLLEANANSPAN